MKKEECETCRGRGWIIVDYEERTTIDNCSCRILADEVEAGDKAREWVDSMTKRVLIVETTGGCVDWIQNMPDGWDFEVLDRDDQIEIEVHLGLANHKWITGEVFIPRDTPKNKIEEVAIKKAEDNYFNNRNTEDEVVFVKFSKVV